MDGIDAAEAEFQALVARVQPAMDMDQHVLLIARLITRNKTDAEVSDVGECVVDRVGPRGSTALAMACATGHLAEAEALLGANCDPNLECCAFEDKYTAAEKHVGEKLLCTALARSQTARGGIPAPF